MMRTWSDITSKRDVERRHLETLWNVPHWTAKVDRVRETGDMDLAIAEVELDHTDIAGHRAACHRARTSLLLSSRGDARSPWPGPLLGDGTEAGHGWRGRTRWAVARRRAARSWAAMSGAAAGGGHVQRGAAAAADCEYVY
jgi:hypothetical protein